MHREEVQNDDNQSWVIKIALLQRVNGTVCSDMPEFLPRDCKQQKVSFRVTHVIYICTG